MGIRCKTRWPDLVVSITMSMRSVESFVIPVLLADRVADDYPGYSHASLQKHPCQDNNGSAHDPVLDAIQSEASRWSMIYWLTSALPGAIIAILLGGWSDHIGRRLLMIVASLGYALEAAIAICVIHWRLPLAVLIAGSSLEGLMGGFPAILLACYSYASDRSDAKQRTARLVIIELAMAIGNGLGNVAGGLLIKHVGPIAAEGLVLSGHCANIIYVAFFLAESNETTNRAIDGGQPQEPKHLISDQTLKNPLISSLSEAHHSGSVPDDLAVKPGETEELPARAKYITSLKTTLGLVFRASPIRPRLLVILFSFELLVMNYLGCKDIIILYTMHKPLCWTSDFIGYFMAGRYAAFSLSLIIFELILYFFKPPDNRVVQVAVIGVVAYMLTMCFATHDWIMYLAASFSVIGGPGTPTLRSMASKLVAKENHGALFSTIAFLETVITVLATVIYNNLYSELVKRPSLSVKYMPNAGGQCFLIIAGLNLLPIIAMQFLPRDKRFDKESRVNAVTSQTSGYGSFQSQDSVDCPRSALQSAAPCKHGSIHHRAPVTSIQ